MRVEPFGESSAGPVQLLTIGAEPGPVLEVLDLGATVHRLWVTCGDGVRERGARASRSGGPPDLACLPGRHDRPLREPDRWRSLRARRAGRASSRPTTAATPCTGPRGLRPADLGVVDHGDDHVVLQLASPDGDQGFPGRLVAGCASRSTAERAGPAQATSDAPTAVCLTSHAYFNLDGRHDRTPPAPRRCRGVPARGRHRHPAARAGSGGRHGVRPASARPCSASASRTPTRRSPPEGSTTASCSTALDCAPRLPSTRAAAGRGWS